MAAVMIGSGIFAAPAAIAHHVERPGVVLALWAAGGLLALCGALTYAELASRWPRTGGVYVFLREGYGPATAFVFGWAYMLLIKPFAAGGIAIVFAEHFNSLLGIDFNPRLETCIALVLLTWLNARGTVLSASIAGGVTLVKAGSLVAIVALAGVFAGGVTPAAGDVAPVPWQAPPWWAAVLPVMAAVMWTYDGWADVGTVAGEVRDPRRTLPRVYIAGTLAVAALYVAVNWAYFSVMSPVEMRGVESVAPVVMDRLIGPAGAIAVAVVVIISTLGSSHASILTGARVTFAQARDGLMFRFLGAVSGRGTPAVALWVQCALSCTAVMTLGGFAELAGAFVFTMWIFYGMAGAVIFIARGRADAGEQPFRCPGYPLVPILFIASALTMTAGAIAQRPGATLPWLAILAMGWPVYWFWLRLKDGSPPPG